MATLGSALVAVLFLGPQVLHAWYLDRTIAKRWKRLPVFGPYSPGGTSRRRALYDGVWQSGLMALVLLGFSVWQDFDPRARSDTDMILATGFVMFLWSLIYLVRAYLLGRWIRTGKPTIAGLRHPKRG